ncbi:MAG: dihydroneopterin aldolase [Pseudomonadota bacterium]
MSDEIRLAFAHPAERSQATEPDPRDRISVRDHVVDVEIGAFQAERGVTQRVRFNIVVEIAPLPDDLDDDVDRILSYDRVTEAIEEGLAAERLNLLETLAERIAERILAEPQAMRVFVRIEKLDRGPGTLGVEIVRSRRHRALHAVDATPQPRVVHLTNAAIAHDNLTGWVDQLAQSDRPVILTVDAPSEPAPQVAAAMAQRRIDLLAIEQNAWRLAARDRRCVVVGTRTELDWGMRHGQISVWAPSKVVLDAVEGPQAGEMDALALSVWFAEEMGADAHWLIGDAGPGGDQKAQVNGLRIIPTDQNSL